MLSNTEKWFNVVDQSANLLQSELQVSYLEAVTLTGDNLFEGAILQEEVLHNEILCKRLKNEYDSINLDVLSNEEIRKGFQLAILKGMKEATQAHHQMTPDAVALFISYLVDKMTKGLNELTILDPAIGTANLLTAVINHLPGKQINSYGVEVDDLLVKLGYINANLQKQHIEFFNRDALQDLFIDPVDLVVCDLPVGYYPNDEVSEKFQLKSEEGHSLAHHLFIEQSFHYTKPGGKLLFVIPNNLFESKESPKLHSFLKEHGVIHGLLQLPLSMFKNDKHAKSIFLVQKKGPDVKMPKQALLAELPSFSNKKTMQGMIQRIDNWFLTEF
ncbi:class I SAM-dependent methyltransferase [Bacillus sp. DJP31]|uniref:class I SAM-dependent methyltransferase n=1 Tax=Bacillus sp. DJP31 TaxID=3409789 RepID=UPI003BB591C3